MPAMFAAISDNNKVNGKGNAPMTIRARRQWVFTLARWLIPLAKPTRARWAVLRVMEWLINRVVLERYIRGATWQRIETPPMGIRPIDE